MKSSGERSGSDCENNEGDRDGVLGGSKYDACRPYVKHLTFFNDHGFLTMARNVVQVRAYSRNSWQ